MIRLLKNLNFSLSSNFFFGIPGYGVSASLFRISLLWLHSLVSEVRGNAGFRITTKRLLVLSLLLFSLPLIIVWNHLGLFFDDLLFPLWKKTTIRAPLFLIGNARSGTTWFHRLLHSVADIDGNTNSNRSSSTPTERFTTFKTWEILFAISVTWKYLFRILHILDKYICFGLNFKIYSFLEDCILGHIKVHPIGLFKAEEDEWLMLHIGLSQLSLFLFPTANDLLRPLVYFDYHPDMLPYIRCALGKSNLDLLAYHRDQSKSTVNKPGLSLASRIKILEFYQNCVQRHIYFQQHWHKDAPAPIFISKNPSFTLRVSTLRMVFPDARIVCMVRDPLSSIPSMVSYIAKVWSTFSSPLTPFPSAKLLLGFCEAHYLFPLVHLNEQLQRRDEFAFVSYHLLSQNTNREIASVLSRLYGSDSFDWAYIEEKLRTAELETGASGAAYISQHKYDLSSCGVSSQDIRHSLATVYKFHKNLLEK